MLTIDNLTNAIDGKAILKGLSLTINANLVREVTVSPPSLAFSTSGGAKQSLTITDRRAKPLTITRAMTTFLHVGASTPVVRSCEVVRMTGYVFSGSWNRSRNPAPMSPSSAVTRAT